VGFLYYSIYVVKEFVKKMKNIFKNLPEGDLLYPEDVVTEETIRDVTEEVIREKILLNTSDEIPHSVAVKIESYTESDDIDRIYATIYCETKSQKGILIGKGGSLLKKIGTEARLELEKIVEKKVFLGLEVKVEKLKNENISSMVTLSEETRRMQDMMKMYSAGGMGMDDDMFGGGETLVLNSSNKLVQYILDNKEGEHTEMFCKQLYDLAMIANKPLKAEAMTEFIARSNEIMLLLAE